VAVAAVVVDGIGDSHSSKKYARIEAPLPCNRRQRLVDVQQVNLDSSMSRQNDCTQGICRPQSGPLACTDKPSMMLSHSALLSGECWAATVCAEHWTKETAGSDMMLGTNGAQMMEQGEVEVLPHRESCS
jgi:hypothetical protein